MCKKKKYLQFKILVFCFEFLVLLNEVKGRSMAAYPNIEAFVKNILFLERFHRFMLEIRMKYFPEA